jgi:carotenoid cleavage dioxygenase-like enzyme
MPNPLTPAAALFLLAAASLAANAEDTPQGVQQLLPRNAIASVDDPVFVPTAEASMPDDAWILGVVVGNEARAYSLNLLNRHEIVNDEAAGIPFAAVW